MSVLQINNLSKQYGNLKVVDGININVEEGSVFGFLGLNGAGKTTTIRMITGLAKPTGGEITVCGDKVIFGSSVTNKHIGYLPDIPEFYGYMKPKEYLTLCGKLCELNNQKIEERSEKLLRLVGLENVKRNIAGFSRGMKQRLGIAQALIHEPELLILDEPTSALDPVGRKEILDIITELKKHTTILFSTHILSDVERVCDKIGVLHKGKIVLQGSIEEIHDKYSGQSIRIETSAIDKLPELINRLSKFKYIKEIRQEGPSRILVICKDAAMLNQSICPLFAEMGIPLSHFERMESNLEDVFLEVIKK